MEKEVINIIANRLKLKANEIKATDRLSEDLKADSIDMVELITDFEEKFNIVVNGWYFVDCFLDLQFFFLLATLWNQPAPFHYIT